MRRVDVLGSRERITPEGRRDQTAEGAFDEAARHVRSAYLAELAKGDAAGKTFDLVLQLESPPMRK